VRIGPSAGLIRGLLVREFDERVEGRAQSPAIPAGFEVEYGQRIGVNDTAAATGRWPAESINVAVLVGLRI